MLEQNSPWFEPQYIGWGDALLSKHPITGGNHLQARNMDMYQFRVRSFLSLMQNMKEKEI